MKPFLEKKAKNSEQKDQIAAKKNGTIKKRMC